jgi:hypothetical protein
MAEKADADDKKPLASHGELLWEVFAIVLAIILLLRVLGLSGQPGILQYVSGFFTSTGPFVESAAFGLFQTVKSLFWVMSNVLSAFFIVLIIYSSVRIFGIDLEWRKQLYPEPQPEGVQEELRNTRWDQVITHIQSDNPSDWRLAILEADIVLDDLLDRLGYVGDTIGDKLKAADPAHFRTLNAAWEAHRVRNAIAHEGQDYILTQREARRVINLYESVFREFDYI